MLTTSKCILMLFFFRVSLISLAFGTLHILFIDETIKLLGPFTFTNTKKKAPKIPGPSAYAHG